MFEFVFFCSRSKKASFFQVERLLKKFYDAAKQKKSFFSGEENRKLNTAANMVAKIDIDALTLKKNQEQMKLKIGKNSKQPFSTLELVIGSKTEQCTSTCSLLKNFETYCCC